MNKLLRKLETCRKPVASRINGLALGGGLEVALACHYRVAANDNPKLQLGLPEAKVGLMPGAGGTQRLPRLIGAQAAAPLLLQGESMTAEQAKAIGVVHELAPTERDWSPRPRTGCKANPNAKAPWDEKGFKVPGGLPQLAAAARPCSRRHRPCWPSRPRATIRRRSTSCRAVYEGLQVPIDAALRIESRYFVKTLMTPGSEGHDPLAVPVDAGPVEGRHPPGGLPDIRDQEGRRRRRRPDGRGHCLCAGEGRHRDRPARCDQEAADKGKAYSQRIVDKDVVARQADEGEGRCAARPDHAVDRLLAASRARTSSSRRCSRTASSRPR